MDSDERRHESMHSRWVVPSTCQPASQVGAHGQFFASELRSGIPGKAALED
jgi:hypothetical protein